VLKNEPEVTHAFDAWAPAFDRVVGKLWAAR